MFEPQLVDPEEERQWLPAHLPSSRSNITASSGRLVTQDTQSVGRFRCSSVKGTAKVFLESRLFIMVNSTVIAGNAVLIGFELSSKLQGEDNAIFRHLKNSLIAYYASELLLRFGTYGVACLKDNWVKFDFALLSTEILGDMVLDRVLPRQAPLMVLRVLKFAPLARTARPIVRFRILRVLVKALLNSAGIMLHTLVLLTLFLYVFSILGLELIGTNKYAVGQDVDGKFRDIAARYFANLGSTMLTLVQFICLDTIGAIYRPLVMRDAKLALYFVLVTLVIPILLMNLVTGVVVSRMQEHIQQDKEETIVVAKRTLAQELQTIFNRLDDDRSGSVSRAELQHISQEDWEVLRNSTSIRDPMTIFDTLDVEETGSLGLEEFCNGVWKISSSMTRLEVQRAEKQVSVIFRRLKNLESSQVGMQRSLLRVLQLQESMQELAELQRERWGPELPRSPLRI